LIEIRLIYAYYFVHLFALLVLIIFYQRLFHVSEALIEYFIADFTRHCFTSVGRSSSARFHP